MPVWLAAILGSLIKSAASAAFPIALKILEKTGVINSIEATGIKAGTHILQAVESIKVYPVGPGDGP